MTDQTSTTDPTPLVSGFQITALRGHDLLKHVLSLVEEEAAFDQAADDFSSAGIWDQGTWGRVDLARLAAIVELPEPTTDSDNGYYVPAFVTVDPEQAITCGTAFCFAGHTTLLAGDKPIVEYRRDSLVPAELYRIIEADTGEESTVSHRAADLLGIDSDQANILFDGNNTLDDLRRIVECIVNDEEIEICSSCETPVWRCDDNGEVCGECGEHETTCECCPECELSTCECCSECDRAPHSCECCSECDRAECVCDADDE